MTQVILGGVLFLLSLLAAFPAPNNLTWMLSVAVREFGWVLAILCLPLLWPFGVGAVPALVAAVLFLVPLWREASYAKAYGADKEALAGGRPAPFVWRDLLLGVHSPRATRQTITYAVHDGKELKLDLYQGAGAAGQGNGRPVVLVIHGGSWRGGDRTQLPKLNHYLAARGYLVAAMSYRLAPAYRFPDMLADVRAAVAWLKAHAAEYGGDPGRLALLGRSAGAHLATIAGFTDKDPAVRGIISYYGPFDIEWGYDQPCKVLDSKGVLGDFMGGDPRQLPDQYRAASAPYLVTPDCPPILMIQGAGDTMVAPTHCDHLIPKLEAAGVPYEYVLVPVATHGSDLNFSGPFGQVSTFAVERFLHRVMN